MRRNYGTALGGIRAPGRRAAYSTSPLNSAAPNFLAWDASGVVGDAQLERFRRLCGQLGDGPRIVVSHYPILMENHKPEPRWHRVAARRRPVRRRKVPVALVLPVLRVRPVQPVQGAAALAVDAALRRLPSAWGHRSR